MDARGDGTAFDRVAELAAHICATPTAAVGLVGAGDEGLLGSIGLDPERNRSVSSFWAAVIGAPGEPLRLSGTGADPRPSRDSVVIGVPLLSPDQVPIGAVCVLGDSPRPLSPTQLDALRALAAVAGRLLEARHVGEQLAALRGAEETSREQFRRAFDYTTLGLTLADEQGIYVQVNRAFATMLGYTAEQLIGRSFRDITAAGEEGADVAAISELVSGEQRAALREKRYRHRDGRLIPAMVSTSLIQREPDAPWLLLNSVQSLEERRAAEQRLLELHSAVDGIVSLDAGGRIVAWNLGAQRMLGYSAADMIGRHFGRVVTSMSPGPHDAEPGPAASGWLGHLAGSTVEVPVVHVDGHELLAELSLSSWSDEGRAHYTAILRDITAQRRTEIGTALVRHAAVAANNLDSFPVAAGSVVTEVCDRLGWIAGHAWTASDRRAVWHVAEHAHHDPDDRCELRVLAREEAAPSVDQMPFDRTSRVTAHPDDLVGMGAAVPVCGIQAAVAVPVLAGGEVVGMVAFYLPAGVALPDGEVVATLEQVGLALGRVVERQRTQATLMWQATHDPVTDLADRRLLLDHIRASQMAAGDADHRRSAVLLINLDRFRLINDSLGYAAGDQALRQVAERLRRGVAESDLVARLGADEFVVLAHREDTDSPGRPDEDPQQQFTALADHLLRMLHLPLHLVGHRLQVRASIGICPITAEHSRRGHNPAGVLRDADAALRQAKRRGRDQIQVYDAALRNTADQRVADETALAHAITGGELVLYYQPIVALGSGRPDGAEALVRWSRPGRGLIPPDQFIPLAEESGLIVDLGRWVLRRACIDAATWHAAVPAMATTAVSVNVSTRQLTHPRFLTDLDEALSDSGLPASRLVVEVTETALIEDSGAVMETLHAVRRRGIQVALDDFGTGYSSLSYVQHLPATILKIDKSFVDPIEGPGNGTVMSEVVLKLAEATGLRTVAEGVQTVAQAEALRQLGCQRGQGYLWSKPVPHHQLRSVLTADLDAWVDAHRR